MDIISSVNSKIDHGVKKVESTSPVENKFLSTFSKYAEILFPLLEGKEAGAMHLKAKKHSIKEETDKNAPHEEIIGKAMKRISKLKQLEDENKR